MDNAAPFATTVASTPTPSQNPTLATPPPMQRGTDHECKHDGNCAGCLKGGFPIRKELSTFLALLFMGISIVLFVFLIQEKRELLRARQATGTPAVPSAEKKQETNFAKPQPRSYPNPIALPKPRLTGTLPVEKSIAQRRSRREFAATPVSLAELSQMLWAGQGITDPETGKRTVPSARESYPFTIFVVVRNVTGLKPGLYEYLPKEHALGDMALANAGEALTAAGVQAGAQNSPVAFIISAAYGKAEKMGASAVSSSLLEAGHIGQNLYLQTESLKMSIVAMAGFDAQKVGTALKLDPAESIVYLFPFGHQAPEKPASPVPASTSSAIKE